MSRSPWRSTPPTRVSHPARWSREILDALAPLVPCGSHIHDPFAGTGERLGTLADRCGWTFTGTEIEASFIVDTRVNLGDSTKPSTYPEHDHVIVTSPVYPNGMADHFAAADASRRNTYRVAIRQNEGSDRELDPRNMGRWGYRGRGQGPPARQTYWRLADDAVACWAAPLAIVNVKDFVASGVVEPVVDQWAEVLRRHGYEISERIAVACPGNRFGANGSARVEHEAVLVAARRIDRPPPDATMPNRRESNRSTPTTRSSWHSRTLAELDHEVLTGRLTPDDALAIQQAHRVMQPTLLPEGWHHSRCLLIDPAPHAIRSTEGGAL